jgi:hypothetical protein
MQAGSSGRIGLSAAASSAASGVVASSLSTSFGSRATTQRATPWKYSSSIAPPEVR